MISRASTSKGISDSVGAPFIVATIRKRWLWLWLKHWLPTAPMIAPACMPPLVTTSSSRSSAAPTRSRASRCCQGRRVATAIRIAVEIVRFAVQPRRWVVERFFAWINRNRRLWGRRGHNRIGHRLPLRRRSHGPHSTHRPIIMSFGTLSICCTNVVRLRNNSAIAMWRDAARPTFVRRYTSDFAPLAHMLLPSEFVRPRLPRHVSGTHRGYFNNQFRFRRNYERSSRYWWKAWLRRRAH